MALVVGGDGVNYLQGRPGVLTRTNERRFRNGRELEHCEIDVDKASVKGLGHQARRVILCEFPAR